MHFIALCKDQPNSLDLRMCVRPTHLTYLADHSHIVREAGPILDDQGNPIGSLVIIEADNLAQAQTFYQNDPYALEGLFASVDVYPWKWTIHTPTT